MDIDYSPTGREFVTGSYDRTVSKLTRIYYSPIRHYFNIKNVSLLSYLNFPGAGADFPL